jgi:hypothetical protein
MADVRRGEIIVACSLARRPVVIAIDGLPRTLLTLSPASRLVDGSAHLAPESVAIGAAITPRRDDA